MVGWKAEAFRSIYRRVSVRRSYTWPSQGQWREAYFLLPVASDGYVIVLARGAMGVLMLFHTCCDIDAAKEERVKSADISTCNKI